MKVISEDVVVALLDCLHGNLGHSVKMLEISIKHGSGDDLDLRAARANLKSIESTISFVKIHSFDASEIYKTKAMA
jgi:hypothetical protein